MNHWKTWGQAMRTLADADDADPAARPSPVRDVGPWRGMSWATWIVRFREARPEQVLRRG